MERRPRLGPERKASSVPTMGRSRPDRFWEQLKLPLVSEMGALQTFDDLSASKNAPKITRFGHAPRRATLPLEPTNAMAIAKRPKAMLRSVK